MEGHLKLSLQSLLRNKYSPDYVPRVESNNVINSGNRNESQRAGLLENRSIVENSTLEPLVNNSEG